jgi:hypothetical protein
LVPGAVKESLQLLNSSSDTMRRFDRVVELVQGFETSFGLELLATVHWVAKYELNSADPDAVVEGVRNWGPQKQKLTDRQIRLALERLVNKAWLPLQGEQAAQSS